MMHMYLGWEQMYVCSRDVCRSNLYKHWITLSDFEVANRFLH
jgi:hypothetical protein